MEFNNINYLLGAYYHQDWFLEKSEPLDIVDLFSAKETEERVKALKVEIEQLLNSKDDLPEEFIYEHNGYYCPSSDGLTVKEWFKKVLDKL